MGTKTLIPVIGRYRLEDGEFKAIWHPVSKNKKTDQNWDSFFPSYT